MKNDSSGRLKNGPPEEQPAQGQTYASRIWEKFSSHPENMFGLYLMLVFFVLALVAPLISSSYPFYWATPEKTEFPWFTQFFSARLVDKFYNMSLLSLLLTGLLYPAFSRVYWRGSGLFRGSGGRMLLPVITAILWGISWYLLGTTYVPVPWLETRVPLPSTLLYGLALLGSFLAWRLFDWSYWWRSNALTWSGLVFASFLTAGLLTFPDNLITVESGSLVSNYPERYDEAEGDSITAILPPVPRLYTQQNLYSQSAAPLSYPLTENVVRIIEAEKQKELLLLYAQSRELEQEQVRPLREADPLELKQAITWVRNEQQWKSPGEENQEETTERISRIERVTGLSYERFRQFLSGLPDPGNPEKAVKTLKEQDDTFAEVVERTDLQYIGLSQKQYKHTERYRTYRERHPMETSIYLLGSDARGNDMLTWALYGSRISLSVGFVATVISLLIGIVLGSFAGYFGGWVDLGISRLLEVVIIFPQFFLIVILLSMVENRQMFIFYIMVLIGLLGWPGTCRLIRGTSLEAREEEYSMAARALGAGNMRIIFQHVLPNSIYPIFVSAPFAIAAGVIMEGGLSMIGYGAQQYPSWGRMLQYARENGAFYHHPHLIIIPILFLFFAVLSYILVGFGLRDAVDPKMKAN